MAYATCPNCGITMASALSAEPPSTCPDCCSKLTLDAALAGPAPGPSEEVRSAVETTVVSGIAAPAEARRAFASFCSGLSDDVTQTGSLLISEVVTNAVLHGHAVTRSTIALHFAVVGDVMQVEVSDDGPGFVSAREKPPLDAESGRGLGIVEALARSWGVDSGRPTRVWFELSMEPAAAPVPA